MRMQRKNEKKGKSKSLERKSLPKKQMISFLANCDLNFASKTKGLFGDTVELERRSARSQQGSRASNRK